MDAEFDDPAFVAAAASLDRPTGRDPNASNANRPKIVQPVPQKLKERQGPSAILVSTRQKGNPVLNYVKTVPWEYSDIPCDYVVGATSCVLFLSLKYHRLHPEYIYNRIRQLGKSYNLRILLTMVDIENHEQALQELSKTSMINNLTLILAWSAQEAGRYLELYKAYEHASPNAIRARQSESWQESLTEFITTPRQINKTDAASLISNFGSLRSAVNAEAEELALIPGWGEKKIRSWYTTVREPFRIKRTARQAAPNLDRNDSSIAEGSSRGATPEYIPVGSIPARQALSRESTRPEDTDSRPITSHKRHRMEEILPDEFNDEDEAALIAAEQAAESSTITQDADKRVSEKADTSKDPGLSAGIAAALAKYRADT